MARFFQIAFASAMASMVAGSACPNALLNPGADSLLSKWSGKGSVTVTFMSGNYFSLSTGDTGLYQTVNVPSTATTVTIGGDVQSSQASATTGYPYLYAIIKSSTGAVLKYVQGYDYLPTAPTVSTSWISRSTPALALPAGAAKIEFWMRRSTISGAVDTGNLARFDNGFVIFDGCGSSSSTCDSSTTLATATTYSLKQCNASPTYLGAGACGGDILTNGDFSIAATGTVSVNVVSSSTNNLYEVYYLPSAGAFPGSLVKIGNFVTDATGTATSYNLKTINTVADLASVSYSNFWSLTGTVSPASGGLFIYSRGPYIRSDGSYNTGSDGATFANPPVTTSSGVQFLSCNIA